MSTAGSPRSKSCADKPAVALVARAARAGAQRPERARVAVLAARLFQPLPAVAHEIAEAPGLVIQGRREEREIAGGQLLEVLGGGWPPSSSSRLQRMKARALSSVQ